MPHAIWTLGRWMGPTGRCLGYEGHCPTGPGWFRNVQAEKGARARVPSTCGYLAFERVGCAADPKAR